MKEGGISRKRTQYQGLRAGFAASGDFGSFSEGRECLNRVAPGRGRWPAAGAQVGGGRVIIQPGIATSKRNGRELIGGINISAIGGNFDPQTA
jgi:hypothetical protein